MAKYPDEVYLSLMAVDPEFQRQKIGTNLVFGILDSLPDIEKLVVITRKCNSDALYFYPGIGFEPCSYMHEGFDPDVYTGFEDILR